MIAKLLPTPSEYPQDQVRSLRKNIRMHLMDGSLYVLGMSMVSVQTILPVFIKELGGSPLSIGSVQVLWTIGQNFPSIFIAHFIRQRVYFRSAMVSWGLAHRLMLLICGFTAFFFVGKVSSSISVPLFLLLIFFIPAIGSVSGLPWFQVFTKTVPIKLRGRLMGVRQLLGSAGGVIGGSLVTLILYAVSFPSNFALLFFVAFIFTMISFYYLTRITELPSIVDEASAQRPNIFTDAQRIIRGDSNFRRFILADVFMVMSLAASSFYSVHAIEKFSLPTSYAGTFTAIVMITNIAANIIFGIIADSYGHKINLLVIALCSALAGFVAIVSTNILIYGFVFFFLACSIQIQAISRLSFIAEMCKETERPVYVGIINTITAPTVFIGILFGWCVPIIGYNAIFFITSLLAVISFLILYRNVQDPRK